MLVKLLLGFAVALFLTYPAAVLTTIIEGQSAAAIYSFHLPTSLFSYFVVWAIVGCHPGARRAIGSILKDAIASLQHDIPIIAILLVYALLVFGNLGRADVVGDDYDLAYQAYNLQDGIQAARKAYVISFNTHPPLFMTIKHYWFNVLFSNGLETVPSWGYRGMEGIMGIATILAVYAITRNKFAILLLAVNNYMVFLGRVYLREMYLTFFITLSIYFFQKRNYLITAFLIGCGLLIKTSAIVVLPVYLLILLYRREFKNIFKILTIISIIYLPVILYNCLAYITTGHMDATFSKIFGFAHPFLTGSASPIENLINSFIYLTDIYSLPILIIFVIASLINFRSIYFLLLISSLLYFIFGGPLREYYLLFMTIPFVILTACHYGSPRVEAGRVRTLLFIILIFYSLYYSIFGNSAARKLYEPSRGWPKLVKEIKSVYQPGDCLEKSGGVNDLALRAYFQTDSVLNYPHFYKMCYEVTNPNKIIKIYYDTSGRVAAL
ncbi:MAG: hypothetical protein Q7S14_01600 [bacterium]|nr:hypothetical protein [bacterium]